MLTRVRNCEILKPMWIKIKSLLDANHRITTQEIADTTVYKHMKRLRLISKLDVWVSYFLSELNLLRRINDCDTLLGRQRNDSFLKRIVTGDQ